MTTFHFVRHGESYGNLAAKAAKETGEFRLGIPWDTPDIPLTQDGIHQAMALQEHLPAKVDFVATSPLKRAMDTMSWVMPNLKLYLVDHSLRDKESGIFDKLSVAGMKGLYPNEWGLRQKLGKFSHRPPGGESWFDVMIRMQEFMEKWSGKFNDILVFTHDVPILVAIMLAHGLTVDEILDYQKTSPVENGSITTLEYERNPYDQVRRDRLDPSRREPVGVA